MIADRYNYNIFDEDVIIIEGRTKKKVRPVRPVNYVPNFWNGFHYWPSANPNFG